MSNKNSLFNSRLFYYGDIVQYYKRSLMTQEEKDKYPRKYLYTIITCCYNIDTQSNDIVYQSLETGEIFSISEDIFCGICKDEQSNQEYTYEKFAMNI